MIFKFSKRTIWAASIIITLLIYTAHASQSDKIKNAPPDLAPSLFKGAIMKGTEAEKAVERKNAMTMETELGKIPNVVCSKTIGGASRNTITPDLISEIIDYNKNQILKRFGDKHDTLDSLSYCYICKNSGLIFYFDSESKKADWLKYAGRVSFNGAKAGMNFKNIMKKLGRTRIMKTKQYRGFEITYKINNFYLSFSSFEPDGNQSVATIFSQREMERKLNCRNTQDDKKPPKFRKRKVLPKKDEAYKDPSLKKTLNELKRAVDEKNYEVLVSYISDEIYPRDSGLGKDGFIKNWSLDSNPKNSTIWHELKEVFKLGGGTYYPSQNSEIEESYKAPYIDTSDAAVLDDFDFHYVTGENVNIRVRPNADSKIIGRLSYEGVYTQFNFNSHDLERLSYDEIINNRPLWYKIATASGKFGYVYGNLRSSLDFRLGMRKQAGGWKITYFVEGD